MARGRIGLLVPFDTSNDRELWRWCSPDASLHITRTAFHDGLVGVPLAQATADLRDTACATQSLKAIDPDVMVFACTSGSFVGGLALERSLRETMIANGARRAATTSGLMLDAFRALNLRRLALATPYPAEVGERLVAFIEEAGYEAVSLENLGLLHGEDIQALPDAVIVDLLRAADRPEADGVFLSCTGAGTLDLVATAEQALGKPVLTAIQVTMWGAFEAAGSPLRLPGQSLMARAAPQTAGAHR